MSTAHRATYYSALGSSNGGGYRASHARGIVHKRDQAAHTALKHRDSRVANEADDDSQVQQLKRVLQQRESHTQSSLSIAHADDITSESAAAAVTEDEKPADDDDSQVNVDDTNSKADDKDSADESDVDDEEEIRRELERIREERRQDRERQEMEARAASHRPNPLLASSSGVGSKRPFSSGLIFHGQSSGDVTSKAPKRFINDAIRSDQHKSFMKSYMK